MSWAAGLVICATGLIQSEKKALGRVCEKAGGRYASQTVIFVCALRSDPARGIDAQRPSRLHCILQ